VTTPKRKKSSLHADLVAFAYDHRFVTAEHVRYHFGLARATAARYLEHLTKQLGYLAVIPVRHALASFPHIYVAAPLGLLSCNSSSAIAAASVVHLKVRTETGASATSSTSTVGSAAVDWRRL
jgi:hypothetical protein